jgi:serine/threonine-protein kinase HipA
MHNYAQFIERKAVSKSAQILLELFETYPQSTTGEIVERTGLARRTIQKYLTLLVNEGKLKAFGEGRGRYYQRVYSSKESLSHLAVIKNDILVGKLSYGHGAYSFEYDTQYKGTELMGISKDAKMDVPALYPVFENLLPEYERRDKLLSVAADSADILSQLYNVQGDFRFIPYFELFKYKSAAQARPSWHTVKNKILGENTYPNLIQAEILISDKILEESSQREHSSLSGYQHKIDINLDLEKGTIEESKRDAAYLMKPLNRTMTDYFARNKNKQKRYYPFLALNEHLFMSFAKNELNLNTPYSGVVFSKDGDFHYIVKRYDRYEQYAYGQYDMAQLLNIPSDKKYNTDTLTILETFTNKVKDEESLLNMFKFQVYASLIQHSDFHAKNVSVLDAGREKYILAPLYDVISMGVYNGKAHDLGLPLSQKVRKYSKYNTEDYLKMANTLGIAKNKAKIVLKQTIEIYLDQFPDYIEKTIVFEKVHDLKIQDTRMSKKLFSAQVQSMYDRKLIQLKKQGVLQEFGLVQKYGGVLGREQVDDQ